jgi:hypothetical protein
MVSKNGKRLTMCVDCQREYWRAKQANKRQPSAKQAPVKTVKTAVKLRGAKPLAHATPQHRDIRPGVLFVDRQHGRFILCEMMSEKAITSEDTVKHTIGFYQQLGYRVVDVVEVLAVSAESAAD